MSHKAKVSVIIPVYNAERFLEETLESLSNQTFKDFEALLVIDKKSKDRSLAIATQWALSDPRFKVFENTEAGGVSANRNQGLNKAQGDYIAFLDSDDLWLPEKLEKQIRFMEENHHHFSCHGFKKITEHGEELGIVVLPPTKISYSELLKDNRIGCLSVMLTKSLAAELRFKDLLHEDMALWLEALRKEKFAYGLPEVLAQYRVVKGSRSNNKVLAAQGRWNILRNIEQLPLWSSIYYFIHYAISALKKY